MFKCQTWDYTLYNIIKTDCKCIHMHLQKQFEFHMEVIYLGAQMKKGLFLGQVLLNGRVLLPCMVWTDELIECANHFLLGTPL